MEGRAWTCCDEGGEMRLVQCVCLFYFVSTGSFNVINTNTVSANSVACDEDSENNNNNVVCAPFFFLYPNGIYSPPDRD